MRKKIKISINFEIEEEIEFGDQYQKPEPLPDRQAPPLFLICPKLLRKVQACAKHGAPLPMRDILKQRGAEIQYALIMQYYKIKMGYIHPTAKKNNRFISSEEAEEIRRLRNEGRTLSAIARKLNRPVSTIYYFCQRNNL